jgi:hypothetical protein
MLPQTKERINNSLPDSIKNVLEVSKVMSNIDNLNLKLKTVEDDF